MWLDLLLVVCMGIGVIAGGYSMMRNPDTYFLVLKGLVERLAPVLLKPEDPETQKKRIQVQQSGGQWDWHRKREKK